MPRSAKSSLLEGLDGIDDELSDRKGRQAFESDKPTRASQEPGPEPGGKEDASSALAADEEKIEEEAGPEESPGGIENEGEDSVEGDVVGEVEAHELAAGQWDCPHCGGSMKVKGA